MMKDWDLREALEKREHFIALGQTTVWLRGNDFDGKPWADVNAVEGGSLHRLSIPVSVTLSADVEGLTFKWIADLETKDANGRGVSLFDRAAIRKMFRRLSRRGRDEFRLMLRRDILQAVSDHTAEIRAALKAQQDSEDCVREIIAWIENEESA